MTTMTTPARMRQATSFAPLATDQPETSVLTRLIGQGQTLRLRSRQALTVSPDSIWIALSGMVATEHVPAGLERTMVELLFPGDIITAPMSNLAPPLSYTCLSPTEIVRLSTSALNSAMADQPEVAGYVVKQLSLQRARAQLHISMLGSLTSEQRVAALLLQAACHLGGKTGGPISFDMPLSRVEVAEYLALNADTLSRIMSRLTREGVVARSSRAQITIRDLNALKAHCPISDAVMSLHTEQ